MIGERQFRQGARFRESGPSILFRLRPDLSITQSKEAKTGTKQFFLKIPGDKDIYHFGEEEFFICQSLDGRSSFQDIQTAFQVRFALSLSEEQFTVFLQELGRSGLLESAEPISGGAQGSWTGATASNLDQSRPDHSPTRTQDRGRIPFRWSLFDPEKLLRFLAWIFGPFGHLIWLLLPATLMAGLIVFHRQLEFITDLQRAFGSLSVLPVFLVSLFGVNLVVRLAQGTVARAFGAKINEFGLILFLGFIPRFFIGRGPIMELPRRGKLWCFATPLLARLTLFAAGTFVWISYRSTGTWLPEGALIVSQIGFSGFVLTSIPLLPNEGYRWMAEFFEQPFLKERALRLLGMRVKGRPAPEALTGRDKWVLLFFAVAVIISMGVVVTAVMLYIGVSLEERYRGSGVAMFLAIFGMSSLWLFVARLSVKRLRADAKASASAVARDIMQAAGGPGAVVPFQRHLPGAPLNTALDIPGAFPPVVVTARRSRLKARLIWAGILGVLAVVMFLPYPYEAGGDFTILPAARVEVPARVDGEVLHVYVKEGDWVEAGQILALLSDWDEERDLAVTAAKLDQAAAILQRLEEGAKLEQVQLAIRQVESAKVRITFSKLETERQTDLYKTGHASRKAFEKAQSEYQKDLADLAVARANLTLVRSDATESEIEAAKAEVRALTREYEYRQDELERTRIRAPAAGRIVTPNLQLQRGKYLPVGGLFAELEDNRVVRAEIDVPETDIDEVRVGDKVRLKPWGYSDTILLGRVASIAPTAEVKSYGRVVRVKSDIPNPDGMLKSEMTGYAKIEGSEMPVWEAYTRLFVRFFRIEFWSWIP